MDTIIDELLEYFGGWKGLSAQIDIRCFNGNPNMKSSLVFLRKTAWARKKVEDLYIQVIEKEYIK